MNRVSGSSTIRGLVINRFGEGIDVFGDTVGNRIEGNFIGTDPTGTIDRGNTDDGVNVTNGASETVVGGTTPAARNVISGNDCNAVFVSDANVNNIQGNAAMSLVNYRKDIVLNVLNLQGSIAISYRLYRAWVSEFQALPEFDAGSMNTVGIQTLTLQHEGWERDTSVTEPTES